MRELEFFLAAYAAKFVDESEAAARARWEESRAKSRGQREKRREAERRATPAWADQTAIDDIYANARWQTRRTGKPFHVDHIVPLLSELVCGLHVAGNLEILPGPANVSKGNRRWPDMP